MRGTNQHRRVRAAFVAVSIVTLARLAAPAQLSVADRQSVDAFISIEDGQPGDPGDWELSLEFGWFRNRVRVPLEEFEGFEAPSLPEPVEGMQLTLLSALEMLNEFASLVTEEPEPTRVIFDDAFEGQWELKYTGKGSPFRENMKLSMVQAAELSDFDADGNGDLELNWQQRWRSESGKMPTLATLISLRLPIGHGSTGYDLTLTGIVNKDFGPGTVFFSASGTVPFDVDDPAVRDFLWAARLGYKWRATENFTVYANYLIQSSTERRHDESNILEFAAQFDVHDRITLGPGILVGLDNREDTPEFGAGIKITIGF